jgi:tetratricopeptide (TPR) repeat protein
MTISQRAGNEQTAQERVSMHTPNGPSLPSFDALWNYDDPAGTEAQFRQLLTPARASNDSSYLAELLTQIARTEALQQRFEDAHRTLDEVESLLATAGDRARVRYLLERGRAFNSSNRKPEARSLFLQAWELARGLGEDFYAVDAAHMMAIVEPPERQLDWIERAMDEAQASADPRAQGWLGSLYNNAGWSYHELGRYDEALATFRKGLEWQRQAGKESEARIAAWTVARALRSLGRYEEALQMQQANLKSLEEAGESSDGYVEEEIGECLLALGRDEEARPHFARAYALLADDPWLKRDEPERLNRLASLGRVSA